MSKIINLTVTDTKSAEPESRNWIFVLDFSGSMGWTLEPLCSQVMDELHRVPIGDTVTIAWFSGVGYQGFIVKGVEVTGEKSFALIEDAIRKNLYTRNTTCFSEILAELQQVVTDLSAWSSVFNLFFFTDGCPVVPSVPAEIRAIEKAISAVADKLSNSLFIGYGNYYNRELMSDMAHWAGGALVHSRDLRRAQDEIDVFMGNGMKSASKLIVDVGMDKELVFSVGKGNVVTLSVRDGKVSVASGATLYALSDTGDEDDSDDAKYAAAAALAKSGRTGEAMDILGELGDRFLIDLLDSAYTLDDIGKAVEEIEFAALEPENRYVDGNAENYLPDPDAFCLLDAIELMVADENAKFYPQDNRFQYNRIGQKTKRDSSYPAFHPDNAGCPMNALTWNKSQLNLSVLALTEGHVLLGRGAAKFQLPEVFGTFRWNNYALIRDGACNVPTLPASFGKDTHAALMAAGMVLDPWIDDQTIHYVALDAVPVINRAIAQGYKSGEDVARLVLYGHELRARLKVLGYYYDLKYGAEPIAIEGYTPEQAAYLETKGIDKNGGYSPKTEKLPPTDFYTSKTFEIKVKGLSSLPKVEDVLDRIKSGKKQTTSGVLIQDAIEWYSRIASCEEEKFDLWLRDARAAIKVLDSKIARAKFAVLLGKSWFDDVDRQTPVIDVDGYQVSFVVGEKKVEF